MAKVGAQRASELTGRSKSTIQRAMKIGKVSFEVEEGGRRVIDVAELERAFGLLPQGAAGGGPAVAEDALEIERLKGAVKVLETQLDAAREQITDLKVQRDLWQKQAQQVLLSNQYTQKQQEITQRMQALKGRGGNENKPGAAVAGLWSKILGKKVA